MTPSPLHETETSTKPRRALVTGCAGFLGSHLSERLLADGVEVLGVDCFTDFYPRSIKEANVAQLRLSPSFTLHEDDLATTRLDDLLEQADVVYHLAAQAGVRGSFGSGFDAYIHHNIRGTQRLLEAATRHPVRSFVYASSSSVYGNASAFPTDESVLRSPVSPYGMTKCATEDLAGVYARDYGVPTVGLRYFTAYGPRQRPDMAFSRFIAAALADEPIDILGDGLQQRDFTFVEDVVAGTVLAAAHGRANSVYNIGGGTPVALIDAVHILEDVLERPIAVNYRDTARGDARDTAADGGRAQRDLGFVPSVSLREGLERQIEWAVDRQGLRLQIA